MVQLAINWTNAAIITCIGFGLVVVLLILLVFVLMGFGAIMVRVNAPKKETNLKPVAVVPTPNAVETVEITGEELAAIAMAIQLSKEKAHDAEQKVLTIVSDPNSAWASKTFGINNLIR
jgi:sodium pump decarboxylase gamma subunit